VALLWTVCGVELIISYLLDYDDLSSSSDVVNATSNLLEHVDVSSCPLERLLNGGVNLFILAVACALQAVCQALDLRFFVCDGLR